MPENLTKAKFVTPPADPVLVSLPKCNIHTHLEGSLRPETVWELAQAQGIPLGIERKDMPARVQVNGNEQSLVDYLDKISIVYPVLKDPEALRRAAFEAAEDAARDGVVYFELRAGPALHARPGLPVERAIECMLEGLHQASQQYGITCGLIVAGLRNHSPEINIHLARTASRYIDAGVVGFDLAGDEANYPPQLHAKAVRAARDGGLGITIHAGEAGGAENVRYAVEELGATRIGHGINSRQSPAVIEMLLERQILLEQCPTSNVHTRTVASIEAHPVRDYFNAGLQLSIGDDDPITSRTQVSNELTLLRQVFGFTLSELMQIQRMTLQSAFLRDENLRQRLLRRVEQAWQ